MKIVTLWTRCPMVDIRCQIMVPNTRASLIENERAVDCSFHPPATAWSQWQQCLVSAKTLQDLVALVLLHIMSRERTPMPSWPFDLC